MHRLARPFVLASALLAVLAAAPARAVFSTETFSALTTELNGRRDSDFAGTLTKQQKAQRAAVLACIARFGKPADDLGDDAASASFAAARLQKAFADEFGAATKTVNFGPLVVDVVTDLTGAIGTDLAAVQARVTDLSGKYGKKARAAATAAQRSFDKAGALDPSKFAARAKLLSATVRNVAKANAYANRATPHGTDGVSATIDGDAYTADTASADFWQGDSTFHFEASRDIGGGSAELIYVSVRGVTGPGTYPFTGTFGGYYGLRTAAFEYTTWNISAGTGSLVVTTLDVAGGNAKGTFSFDGVDTVGPNGTRQVRSGTFDLSGGITTHAGDGFLSKR